MVDLVTHQLNSALCSEVVQGFHFAVFNSRARGVVWAVDQDELGLRVGQPFDLVGVDAEAVLAAHAIEAGLNGAALRRTLSRAGCQPQCCKREESIGWGHKEITYDPPSQNDARGTRAS